MPRLGFWFYMIIGFMPHGRDDICPSSHSKFSLFIGFGFGCFVFVFWFKLQVGKFGMGVSS